uniref:Uncharacterized protein n=1 Tax=viral metagenome TaxID=1070528 RepID=A0A6C0E1C9_9ZZZZ
MKLYSKKLNKRISNTSRRKKLSKKKLNTSKRKKRKKSIKRIDGFHFIYSLKQQLEDIETYKKDLIKLIKIFGELSNENVEKFIEEVKNMTSLKEIETNIQEFNNEIQKLINKKEIETNIQEKSKTFDNKKLLKKKSNYKVYDFIFDEKDRDSVEFQVSEMNKGKYIKGSSTPPTTPKNLIPESDWVYNTPEKI